MRFLLLIVVSMFVCASAFAGPLLNDSNAYDDGVNAIWTGSTTLMSFQGDLEGVIEWCVYGVDENGDSLFLDSFPSSSYTPTYNATHGRDEFVYAYHISDMPGTLPVGKFSVNMTDSNEANNIDDFAIAGGVATDDAYFGGAAPTLDNANWVWDLGLDSGESSVGLVYSSINAPVFETATLHNGGQIALGILPSPSNIIPEPASLSLLAMGVIGLLRRKR